MAKPLLSSSIGAVGFLGINTQESSVNLEDGFALQANNCIIDKQGRLGSRKGYFPITTQLGGVTDDNLAIALVGMHVLVDVLGVKTTISWDAAGNFYTGTSNLVALTFTGTYSAGTNTNWSTATLNDFVYFFQLGQPPLVYDASDGSFKFLSTVSTGTPPNGSHVLSAYGRLWVSGTTANITTVYFTAVTNGLDWTGGGSLNIQSVFNQGADTVVGCAAHNGTLAILCKNSIVIYDDATVGDNFGGSISVTSLRLIEVITNVGCISAKSIQSTGKDVLFLDVSGVRSLGRTIQEKSAPLNDVSKNVRSDLVYDLELLADMTEVIGVYSPKDAFYLLAIPSRSKVYCFDTRQALQDGSLRVTTWSNTDHKAYAYDTVDDELYMTNVNGIVRHSSYLDDTASYDMTYYSNHFNLGKMGIIKFVKKIISTVIGAQGQTFVVKVGSDYGSTYLSTPFINEGVAIAEYNIGEYGIAEYSGGVDVFTKSVSMGGSGEVLQIGLETTIKGTPVGVQKLDILVKTGRIN